MWEKTTKPKLKILTCSRKCWMSSRVEVWKLSKRLDVTKEIFPRLQEKCHWCKLDPWNISYMYQVAPTSYSRLCPYSTLKLLQPSHIITYHEINHYPFLSILTNHLLRFNMCQKFLKRDIHIITCGEIR